MTEHACCECVDRLRAEHAAEKAKADHFHAEYWRAQHENTALWAVANAALASHSWNGELVHIDDPRICAICPVLAALPSREEKTHA